jgi:hypothetical protein
VLREKILIIYNDKTIQIVANYSTETLKARRAWSEVFLSIKKTILILKYSTQQSWHLKLKEKQKPSIINRN